MLMEQSLFVIEAPGKESTLRKILDRLGYNATVMSTKGRLYDLPTNTIGFDLENLNNIHLVALDQKLIDKLSQKISQANAVYIMTDDDPEGELIALHVKNLVKKDIVVERIRCNSMTFEGVKFALVSPSTVDFKIAQGSINRRVFDRISGYLLSGWKDLNSYRNGTVGRVISPFLNYINQNNKTPISISEFAVSSDDGPITISIKKPINSKISDSDISLLMRNCGVITATESSAIMRRIQTKPMNGPESLIFFSQRTGASISDVADSLQELYVNGLISYPRTETKGLSSFAQSTVRSIALSAGDTVDSHDNCKGDEIKTHDGLHVTGYNSCIEGNYSQMHLKDKIWTLLYRNNLSCFKDLILTEKKYNVANPSLMLIIDTLGIELSSFRKTVSEVGYKREYHYDDFVRNYPRGGLALLL
jgi:DNA topoisomerase IA